MHSIPFGVFEFLREQSGKESGSKLPYGQVVHSAFEQIYNQAGLKTKSVPVSQKTAHAEL